MRTDIQLQAELLDELRRDRHVRASEVGVHVVDGIVTLTGTVCSHAKKVAAAEAAHRVPGVLDVANDIEVRLPRWTEPTTADIAHAVRRALAADRLLPAPAIHTTVSHGWVTIEGTVPRVEDAAEAERVVRGVPLVAEVINHLAVPDGVLVGAVAPA
jgi:osmotically-inducible protein OsmY